MALWQSRASPTLTPYLKLTSDKRQARRDNMKIFRPINSGDLDKRIHKEFKKDTDYDIFHKKDGRIVVHFWDEEYLKNNPDKDGRKQQASEQKG